MTPVFNPSDPHIRANPHPMLARLRRDDPAHWSPELKSWVLTRYDDVRRALAAPEMSPDRLTPFYASLPDATQSTLADLMRYLNLWIVFRDPPEHTRLRSLVNKAFLPGTINGFRPEIERITQKLLDKLPDNAEIDLVKEFTMQLPALVIMGMLGVPDKWLYPIKAWSDDIMLFIGSAREVPGKYELARRGSHEMAAFFRAEIAKRRQEPSNDLLSLLISARDERDSLSEDEMVATAMLLLFAGHETTTNLLSNATLALIRNPEARDAFINRQDLVATTAVEEFLRYDAPVNAIGRVVKVEHEIAGKTLKPGDRAFVIINAANRDEEHFPDPDKLDVGRMPNRHLTFGKGIHFCLGAQLARLEGRIALPLLFDRFPNMSQGSEQPVWLDALVMRGLKSLPVQTGARS